MRRTIVLGGLAALVLSAFILLQPDSPQYIYIMRELNRDVVYFADGSLTKIWLWDDKGAAAIGENAEGEISVFNKDEYKEIEENQLLRYLKLLI